MSSMTNPALAANPKVEEALARCRAELRRVTPAGSFAEREEALLALCNEVVRGALEEELQDIADRFGQAVLVEGFPYKRHEVGTVTYHSLCGDLVITRPTYRRKNVRNGPTVVPLELAAQLVERATPALGFNVAHAFAQHDMRVHLEQLRHAWRRPPSRTTLERIANRIAAAAVEDLPRIEPQLRLVEAIPDDTAAVSVGLDRTAVAMLELRPESAAPKAAPKRTKPRKRRAPAPRDINWRMAYVGTVSFVDSSGDLVASRRYAAPACDDPRDVVTRMMADVRTAVRCRPQITVGLVQDGAPEMWNRTREGVQVLQDEGAVESWHEAIDYYHLSERLSSALDIIDVKGKVRRRLLDDWHTTLQTDDCAIDTVERYLRRRHRELDKERANQLAEHLVYIRNNKSRMKYATMRRAGLPIGSGATEGAARTLVGQRAKGRGRRWLEPTLRGVLTLRALRQSDRLQLFWKHFAKRYAANLAAA